jgi:hypothetical protein
LRPGIFKVHTLMMILAASVLHMEKEQAPPHLTSCKQKLGTQSCNKQTGCDSHCPAAGQQSPWNCVRTNPHQQGCLAQARLRAILQPERRCGDQCQAYVNGREFEIHLFSIRTGRKYILLRVRHGRNTLKS